MSYNLTSFANDPLSGLIGILIKIVRFLFLTPFGWILLFTLFLSVLLRKIKDREGKISFASTLAGLSETFVFFLAQGGNLILSVLILLGLSGLLDLGAKLHRSFELWHQTSVLQATLRNIKSERMVAKAEVHQAGAQIQVFLHFFAWQPVSDKQKTTREISYTLKGSRAYLDFGVINFSHTLIEKGKTVNIAFPNRLYSDEISPNKGINLVQTKDGIPPSFELDKNQIYLLSRQEYQNNIRWIFKSATNANLARKIGIRTAYGQGFALLPSEKKSYTFYTTGTGGMIVK